MVDKLLLNFDEPFDVHLESNRLGQTIAHVPQLLGCIVRGKTPEEAIGYVEDAVAQYLVWLQEHSGTSWLIPPIIRTRIVERCSGGAASGSGSRVALLQADRLLVDRQMLEACLLRFDYSRQDLLEITATLPHSVLTFRPQRQQRTIREILQHVAGAEKWYLSRMMEVPHFPAQKTPLLRLQIVRKAAIELLSQYDLCQSARVVHKDGETWTLRKVLRRFLEHEREHVLEIERRLHDMGRAAFPAWMSEDVKARELRLAEVCRY